MAAFRKTLLIPFGAFLALAAVLALGFGLKDPHLLPSALVGKPFPRFELADLHDPGRMRTRADLEGEVALVNVWGTWCPNCVVEHPELMRIGREEGIPLYGINYRDDTAEALAWLRKRGDPYGFSIVDAEGSLAIDLGVYGAPETFVVDRRGVIRLRHVGPVTPDVWRRDVAPVVERLRSGGGREAAG